MKKLRTRDPARGAELGYLNAPKPHPLFRIVEGPVADWEKGAWTDASQRKTRHTMIRTART